MNTVINYGFQGDFEDLFEASPCGLLVMNEAGLIVRANSRFADWLGYPDSAGLAGRKFSGLLTIGGKILV